MRIAVLMFALVTIHASAHDKSLGIIGDSVATGAVAGPIEANYPSLAYNALARGLLSPVKTALGVNFFENSFSTVLSTGLGIRQDRIINVAVNGQRVGTIHEQMTAMLKETKELPDYLVVSYTANNACHEDIFKQSPEEFYKRYYDSLIGGKTGELGLRSLVKQAAGSVPRRIYLMASLDFNETLTNQSILDHEVNLHGTTVKCRAFREGATDLPVDHFLAVKLRQMCPAVMKTDPTSQAPDQVQRRAHLKLIHTAMIAAQREAVRVLNLEAAANVKLQYLEAPLKLKFDGRHVANDCFHLSNQGQGYIGLGAWDEILTTIRP